MKILLAILLAALVATPAHSLARRYTDNRPSLTGTSRRSAIAGGAGVALSPTASFAKDRVAGYPKQNEWETVLTPGQYFVLRNGGTEPPRSSPLLNEKRKGTFVCAGCKAPLFDSLVKFESGTGWPSFATALAGVETLTSFTSFALGSELRCADCGGHLGDVFNDGKAFRGTPAFESGLRYCIDGAALVFQPAGGGAPVSGDGLSRRRYERPADVELPSWLQPPKVSERR
jgi:peptide-methionine (R)-S-oxide reductase